MIYTIRLPRMRQANDRPTTRLRPVEVESCVDVEFQLYDCIEVDFCVDIALLFVKTCESTIDIEFCVT